MKAMMMNTNLYFAYELLESLLYYFLVLEQRLVFRAKIAFQHVVGLRNGFLLLRRWNREISEFSSIIITRTA